ncbi:MAG: glycosyltransferase [Cyclobacteriaceae bacterium]|nr:glycosyltransferase [Cyclobacteriaceae bacterium]
MQLSIVLPVYNVEPYIERCIRSLMDQDIAPEIYEVIVVNDGSPDNSREVVLQLQKEFENIILIDQENKGVSIARNVGIEKAKGAYILFIDPDDYIAPNVLGNVIKRMVSEDLEIMILGYHILSAQGSLEYKFSDYIKADEAILTGPEAYAKARGGHIRDPDRSVGILYKLELIKKNKLIYPENVPYLEDGLFLAKVMCLANYCSFDQKKFYLRTTRPGSATHSDLFFSKKAIDGFLSSAICLVKFKNSRELVKNQIVFLNQPICKYVLLTLIPLCKISSFADFRIMIVRLKQEKLYPLKLEGCNNYYKFEGGLLNISYLFFFLHRIIGAPVLRLIKLFEGEKSH